MVKTIRVNMIDKTELIIMIMAVGVIIFFITVNMAYAEHIPPRYYQWQCSLIPEKPYYDCSQPFVLVWFDTMLFPPLYNYTSNEWYLQDLEDDEPDTLAYTYYNLITPFTEKEQWPNGMDMIVVGNSTELSWFPEDDPWTTILMHEIKHLLCECNFHKESDKALEKLRNEIPRR